MLAFKNRLTKEKDFKKLAQKGKVISRQGFFIKILPNNLEYSRFGIIVSNKISKKATIRNRLKRQIRSLIRSSLNSFKPSFDVVVIVQPGIIKKNYKELAEAFLIAIKKLFK